MAYDIEPTKEFQETINQAYNLARESRHEFLTPEHFMTALLDREDFCMVLHIFDADVEEIRMNLNSYLDSLEKVPENLECTHSFSSVMSDIINQACVAVFSSSAPQLSIMHWVSAMINIDNTPATKMISELVGENRGEFLLALIKYMNDSNDPERDAEEYDSINPSEEEFEQLAGKGDAFGDEEESHTKNKGKKGDKWRQFVTCVNDVADQRNPLIGREEELARTIQVLCRKDKNNPLHVGEPGVGKTALVYGLARMVNEGRVPEKLAGSRIYSIELGNLVSGTSFRGQFEERLKMIMDGIKKEGNAIVHIDEIHNLVGIGAVNESSLDGANLLKPYLEEGSIKFIGTTTYDEYNRFFAKSKPLVRRFQQIDIKEPSVEETVDILSQLIPVYEQFHNVRYTQEAIESAVRDSASLIADRFLPDKAIDIIDEAGAYRELHPIEASESQTVDVDLVKEIMSKICRVDITKVKEDGKKSLATLGNDIRKEIFGQDEAVRLVEESVLMSKAGLTEENKPIASLLFVGPTGVGKTEVARVLAKQLGVELVRLDMSEYAEKYTISRLIGSSAGYVGYEDGGILTDAIRKTPNCVLLLDEIEKAHPDIFNLLLQVMDYARLTDNKGRHSDFRNVVLIMTSNAGAQYAAHAKVGFASKVTSGDAMLRHVGKIFKPEFINRLSATVVFQDMSREMASQILDKKLRQLQERLSRKNVTFKIDGEAHNYILDKGFSPEYGARELDRVISGELKPLFMRSILFGDLKDGGEATVTVVDNKLVVKL